MKHRIKSQFSLEIKLRKHPANTDLIFIKYCTLTAT